MSDLPAESTDIAGQLALLLMDDGVRQHLDVFMDPSKGSGKSLETLLRYSQKHDTANILYQLLQKNIVSFLKGLQAVGDNQGAIITNILLLSSKDKAHRVSQVLTTIKTQLKTEKLKNSDKIFYLQVYLALLTQFQVSFPENVQVFLSLLDSHSDELESLILFIVVKQLEVDQVGTLEAIKNFFDFTIESNTEFKDFITLVRVLDALFPICPQICALYYTSSSCAQIIVSHIQGINPASLKQPNNQLITTSLLKLVSNSCIEELCRKFNSDTYYDLLKVGFSLPREEYPQFKILSTLCLVKLWNFVQKSGDKSVSVENIFYTCIDYLKDDNEYIEYTVETLAYLTLNLSLRIKFRRDVEAITALLKRIKDRTQASKNVHKSSITYGLLLIISNLMQIKTETGSSSRQKTMDYLKKVSDTSATAEVEEDVDAIHNFNKQLILDHKLLDLVSRLKVVKVEKGPNNYIDEIIRIIHFASLAPGKVVRQELVKQGSISTILDYLILRSNVIDGKTRPKEFSDTTIKFRLYAIRALAKILVQVNPALAFNKYSISTSLPFLIEMLGPDISQYKEGLNSNSEDSYLYNDITNVDKFESLLALTNIASIPEDKDGIKDKIIVKTFDTFLDNFILEADVPLIQRAAWQLISNLIAKPKMLVKFFNAEDKQAIKRLNILVKLLELKDLELQVTLAGLLANSTSEYDMISQIILEQLSINQRLISAICVIFGNQTTDTDLILRLSYLLLDLVYAAANIDEANLEQFRKNVDLKRALATVVLKTDVSDVLEVIREIVMFVKFK